MKSVAVGSHGLIVSGSFDNTVRVWNPHISSLAHMNGVWCVAFSGERIVSGVGDYKVRVWGISSSAACCEATLAEHTKLTGVAVLA